MTMADEFCTLFDRHYLARGLVLYGSLCETCDDFRLRVFCMDEPTARILRQMRLPRMDVIGRDELEKFDRDLGAVKTTRSQVEFCWTATPAVCLFALEREPELDAITYLDADLFFLSDPAPLFAELGADSVLIVPHRHAPRWTASDEVVGPYNVEYLTFRNDGRATKVLQWWRERCLEWCYDRFEDGKWGDQRYLDDWPERFPGVHVLEHPGGGLAPWNAEMHALDQADGSLRVDGLPAVFYHCQSLKLVRGAETLARLGLLPERYRFVPDPVPLAWTVDWPLSQKQRELIWDPYVRRLGAAYGEIRRIEPRFEAGFHQPGIPHLAREAAMHGVRTFVPARPRRTVRAIYRALARR